MREHTHTKDICRMRVSGIREGKEDREFGGARRSQINSVLEVSPGAMILQWRNAVHRRCGAKTYSVS